MMNHFTITYNFCYVKDSLIHCTPNMCPMTTRKFRERCLMCFVRFFTYIEFKPSHAVFITAILERHYINLLQHYILLLTSPLLQQLEYWPRRRPLQLADKVRPDTQRGQTTILETYQLDKWNPARVSPRITLIAFNKIQLPYVKGFIMLGIKDTVWCKAIVNLSYF